MTAIHCELHLILEKHTPFLQLAAMNEMTVVINIVGKNFVKMMNKKLLFNTIGCSGQGDRCD